ncbi:MAG: Holliday junction resolvase RuvX [Chloroflexi bacterium]|nr:MAG: Holliday junction resolvase RuvX [Chloroflexota bacterium]
MRIIGLDLGERRIGVAAADDRTRVAIPVTTVTVEGDPIETILAIAREQRADELVVGLPLSMSGALGPQGQAVIAQVEQVRERLPLPVHTWDERLSTVQASRVTAEAGRKKSARTAMAGRDAAAAAIVLQAFIDARGTPR